MTPERWNHIKEIFHAALEREEGEREAFLDGACGSDADLRQEVERLLREHRDTGRLESPVGRRDLSGHTLSHYKISDKIGEGGMGVVYRAEDSKLRRTVALKFLRSEAVESKEWKTRFRNEAEAAAALDHPNICTVYEIDEAEGQTFLAMAYVAGESLSEKVRKRPLPLDEVLHIAIQAAEGLHAAHKKGIVHRDIKSANIMVDTEGRVKIMDFGLAHLAGGTRITKAGTVMGTPAYMSPEQGRGETADHRTDVWSLGVVIYEMVTGRLPFSGESAQSVALAIQNEQPEGLTALRSGIPIELERIVDKTLAKRAAERYQHIEDLLVDLRSLKRQMETGPRPKTFQAKRAPVLVAVAAVATLAVSLAVAVRLRHREAGPAAPPVPFTSHPGVEYSPVFSPDGDHIAFMADIEEEGNYDIYIQQVNRPGPVRITRDPAMDLRPAWSPDGNEIVFARLRSTERANAYDFLVIPAIGGPERKLTETSSRRFRGSILSQFFLGTYWSPDGRFLVLETGDAASGSPEIVRYSMETGETEPFWKPDSAEMTAVANLSYSPDGRSLAFAGWSRMASDIYLLSLDNDGLPRGKPMRLTSDAAFIFGLDWTPDSREIIFSSTRAGGASLWRIPARGGEAVALALGGGSANTPSVARKGSRLAFVNVVRDTDIWRVKIPRGREEKAASPEGLILSNWLDNTPRYSPDGRKIAFTSYRSGNSEIWVCDSDGSNVMKLTDQKDALTGSARWSPDGRWIAFDSLTGGNKDIWVIDASGGVAQKMTRDAAIDARPAWSRDGKWVYFSSDRGGHNGLWKKPFDGGPAVEVTLSGAGYPEGMESPDGKFVYYGVDSAPGIWRVPVEGGEPVRVLDQGRPYGWAMTGDGICVLAPGPAIEFFDFVTEKRARVMELEETAGPIIGVSPDGQLLLYTKEERVSTDIMLVENFR